MYRLYCFSSENGEREFVIISELESAVVLAEYTTDDITHSNTVEIDGYAGSFPCDQELRRY